MSAAEFLMRLALAAATVSVIALTLRASRIALRRAIGAQSAYACWALVPVAFACCFMPTHAAPASAPIAAALPGVLAALPSLAISATTVHTEGHLVAGPSALFTVWCMGALAFSLLALRRQRALIASLSPLVPSPDGIYMTQRTDIGPLLLGLARPRIVIPADFEERYTPTEQELILGHERAHWRRGDMHANLLATALHAALWFLPFAPTLVRAFREDQELACDAAVIATRHGQSRAYAEALLKTQTAAFRLPVGCTLQAHPIKERIMNLNRRLPHPLARLVARLLFASSAAALAGAAWAMTADGGHAQQGDYRVAIEVTQDTAAPQQRTITTRGLTAFEINDLRDDHGTPCTVRVSPTPGDAGQIQLRMQIGCGTAPLRDIVAITRPGQPAAMAVGRMDIPAGRKPQLLAGFRLQLTLNPA